MNIQEMDIYIARRDGLYLYNTAENALSQMSAQDIRALTGKQAFVKDAPVNIVYVADTAKMQRVSAGMIDVYAAADAGFISQNVYLFCSSSGLATVVRARVDKEALGKAMSLRPEQKIIFAQTVGYPKE
jgi:nitroreductase